MASVSTRKHHCTGNLWGFFFPYHINRTTFIYKVEKQWRSCYARSVVLPGGDLYCIFSKIRVSLPLHTQPSPLPFFSF